MATARRVPMMFVTAVLVASSCFADVAECVVPGKVLSRTLLQAKPGFGTVVLTTLMPNTVVDVVCRSQSAIVFDDPWWLKATVTATGMVGWVADYFVLCQGTLGNCNVVLC